MPKPKTKKQSQEYVLWLTSLDQVVDERIGEIPSDFVTYDDSNGPYVTTLEEQLYESGFTPEQAAGPVCELIRRLKRRGRP